MRWLVEIPKGHDNFHDVGADDIEIDHGVLIFRNMNRDITVAYAPGQWVTVTENGDETP